MRISASFLFLLLLMAPTPASFAAEPLSGPGPWKFKETVKLVDFDRGANRLLIAARGGRRLHIVGQGASTQLDISALRPFQDARLEGDFVYLLAGDSPEEIQLIRLSLRGEPAEILTVKDPARSPIFETAAAATYRLRWFRQDPKAEKRAGWAPVQFVPLHPVGDRFLTFERGTRHVDADRDFLRLAWLDENRDRVGILEGFEGTDASLSAPDVDNDGRVTFWHGGYEAVAAIKIWTPDLPAPKTVFSSTRNLDPLGPRWLPGKNQLVIPMMWDSGQQAFALYDLDRNEIISTRLAGHNPQTPYFVTDDGLLVHQISHTEIRISRFEEKIAK